LHAYACYSGKVIHLAKNRERKTYLRGNNWRRSGGDDWGLLTKDDAVPSGDKFADWKMIVSMVALRCCYDQCNSCREEKDAAGGVAYGRRKKIPSAAAGRRAQSS